MIAACSSCETSRMSHLFRCERLADVRCATRTERHVVWLTSHGVTSASSESKPMRPSRGLFVGFAPVAILGVPPVPAAVGYRSAAEHAVLTRSLVLTSGLSAQNGTALGKTVRY